MDKMSYDCVYYRRAKYDEGEYFLNISRTKAAINLRFEIQMWGEIN